MTASIVKEAEGGLTHIAEVLRRWWVLLVVGTAFALGLAGLVLVATPVHYSTQVDALVDQPSLTSSPQAGQPTVQKLAALMPTFAEVALSDVVLTAVRDDLALNRSVQDLRSHIRADVVPQSLVLRITVDLDNSKEATAVSRGIVKQLSSRLTDLEGKDAPPQVSMTVVPLQEPAARSVSRHALRTVGLAFVLGLGFSTIAAFTLERA